MTTRSELRAMARQSLTGQWGRNAFFMLVIYLVVFFIGFVPIAGDIALFVCSGAGTLGIIGYFLDTSRGQRPSFASFFDGFNDFVRAFVLYLLTTIFTLLWTLLFIVPGIIASLRYSQAYFILRDNPEIGAMEALRRSKVMMQGQKWRLFVLILSFIGWSLLCIPTMGIGYLWLCPYVLATLAHFYEDVRKGGEPFGQPQYAQAPPPPYTF